MRRWGRRKTRVNGGNKINVSIKTILFLWLLENLFSHSGLKNPLLPRSCNSFGETSNRFSRIFELKNSRKDAKRLIATAASVRPIRDIESPIKLKSQDRGRRERCWKAQRGSGWARRSDGFRSEFEMKMDNGISLLALRDE